MMLVIKKLVCYTLCYCVVNGQQDFNADQSSETDGGLGNFGTNTGLDNSRFLQFEDFFRNLRSSSSVPSSRATTQVPTSDDSFNDFQVRNFNSQFRNFGGRPDGSRNFGQSSTFDSGEEFRSDDANSDSGISQRTDENTRTRFQSVLDRNDNFDNFGSQFSNFNGFSPQSRQRGSNTTPRSTTSRRSSSRSDDDSGASSFSFFSRNFNK